MTHRHCLRSFVACTAFSLMLLGLPNPGAAQTWTEEFPAGAPPAPRWGAMYAYDEINDRLIVFGGDVVTPVHAHPNDVWVLINATGSFGSPQWVLLRTSGGPPSGRHVGTLVYDPTSNRIILHGGCGDPFSLNHCSPGFKDAWYLTNANGLGGASQWFPLPPSNVHSSFGRELHTAVYDSGSNRMIVFGGTLPFHLNERNDVEILLNANGMGSPSWMFLSPGGPLPSPRQGASAVYDSVSNLMMVFGGHRGAFCSPPTTTFNDVWVLIGANGIGSSQWSQLSPTGTPPSARSGHSAVYDPSSNRMIVFGGVSYDSCASFQTFFNDVWALTNANGLGGTPEWIELTPSGVPPLGRFFHAAGYSSGSNRMIIATGHNRFVTPNDFNDVWVLSTNAVPIVAADNPTVDVPEGAVAYNTGSFSDPGDDVSLTASLGVIESDSHSGTWSWSFPTDDGPVQSQTVTITATDSQGASAEVSFDLIVHNLPPELDVSASASVIDENRFVTLSGVVGDPGVHDTQNVVIDWGDDSTPTALVLGGGGGSFAEPHQYLDDDPTATPSDIYRIAISVADKDGGADYARTEVLVNNVPPVINTLSGPTGPLALGNSASVSASFTDIGTLDTHSCTFAWDDGSPSTTLSASTPCSATHGYAAAGVYTVVVTVTDDDTGRASANFEYVVVYDSNGGFVTGGGWINSPPGAYAPEPSLTGKANFGFVSKYKPGATVPTGNTEFQFHAAGLNFHSSSYQWLVVAGARAQYKGSGTINGSGDYGFLLTARDGQVVGGGGVDKFRIKIWSKSGGGVVYDNATGPEDIDSSNTQALGGGSIVIHK